MISDEEGKAVQEVAKLGGKAIDAGSKMGQLIAGYIGGPLEQAIGIWEDKLKYRRWENQISLMERAARFLRDKGLEAPTRTLSLSLEIPLLEEASLVDNAELRDRWARLLANAADAQGPEIRRAYIGILAEMTPLDASILEMVFDLDAATPPNNDGEPAEISTADLPVKVAAGRPRDFLDRSEAVMNSREPTLEVELSAVNLARMGLICSAAAFGGMANMRWVSMTELGRQFVVACRP